MHKSSKHLNQRIYNRKWMANKRRRIQSQKKEDQISTNSEIDLEASDVVENLAESSQSSTTCHSNNVHSSVHCSSNMGPLEEKELAERDGNTTGSNNFEKCNNNSQTNPESNMSLANFTIPVSSSDEEMGSEDNSENLCDSLNEWANKFEIKANAIDGLLKILQYNGHESVPRSSRTLLKTPREIEHKSISGMTYFHFGLRKMMISTLTKFLDTSLEGKDNLILMLNIDDVPLFKSTNSSAWPILCVICNIQPLKPFLVTLTVGNSKPTDLDFLHECIAELEDLSQNGFNFNSSQYTVRIKCIICDAPAKAFVKAAKQYSGYNGCDKCEQNGLYIGRMTYPETQNLNLRTDHSFRSQQQRQFHKGTSPFLQLPLNMIDDFPIDYIQWACDVVATLNSG